MAQVERQREIKRRRNRKAKIRDLRERLNSERDSRTRARLIAKIKKISPAAPVPER